jgi:hypothetical protein
MFKTGLGLFPIFESELLLLISAFKVDASVFRSYQALQRKGFLKKYLIHGIDKFRLALCFLKTKLHAKLAINHAESAYRGCGAVGLSGSIGTSAL